MPELRVESATALDRLARLIAVDNGLTPEEGREEAGYALGFLSALLDLPSETLSPRHGTTPQSPRLDQPARAA